MNNKRLLFKNVKKNGQGYFLYLFALIFSVALYFTFITLQYDAAMNEMNALVEGAEAIQVGAIFLVVIVTIFLLYANNLFLKRRSKEIGLYQLVGMSKGQIFRILSLENLILYMSALLIGIFIGFSFSKLLVMILFKLIQIETITTLNFSFAALNQTILVFTCIVAIILFMNYVFLKRQRLIDLFQKETTTEAKKVGISVWLIISGVLGIICILSSYVFASKLFSGDYSGNTLFLVMFIILILLSVGTYLFFKGSIEFVLRLIRKKQDGHVTVSSVLALSTIMFRMKSNALLLTIITLLSTVAITLSSIATIAYYSAEQTVKEMVPHDFSLFEEEEVDAFTKKLDEKDIDYTTYHTPIIHYMVDIRDTLVPGSYDQLDIYEQPKMLLPIITDPSVHLQPGEVVLTKPDDLLGNMLELKESGSVTLFGGNKDEQLTFVGVKKERVLPSRLSSGFSVLIVDENMFEELALDTKATKENEFSLYIGININQRSHIEEANDLFHALGLNTWKGIWTGFQSQLDIRTSHMQGMGLLIFITGFLGFTFLITSGCILYFKQMDESAEDKDRFMILRKLGFSREELVQGIRFKQMLNFGIPLVIGLSHSYFVVKSGWFIFGKEMWTPMLIVMVIYSGLYWIFTVLSIQHDKKVIRDSL